MWLDNKRLFFLSGIASFGLFFIVLAVILWQATLIIPPIMYAASKSNFVAISLETSSSLGKTEVSTQPQKLHEKPIEKVHETKPEHKEMVLPKKETVPLKSLPQEKSSSSKVKTAQPEINDLFATVKTTRPPKPTKKNSSELAALNALEKEVLSSKRSSQLFEKAKSLDLVKSDVQVISASTGANVDKYMAKIQGLVKRYFYPPTGSSGESSVILLRLDAMGKMINFKILRSSKNQSFNVEVNLLKDRLSSIRFPETPDGKEGVLTCTLTAKE
jgi:hypothetical protein